MKLDDRTIRLIVVGVSISANCQPCLGTNVSKALENGIAMQEIADAIEIGKMVRKGAASKMDRFAASLAATSVVGALGPTRGCECDL